MDTLLDPVQAALDALRAVTGGRDVAGLAPGVLVAVSEAFGVLRRRVEAAFLPVAAEIGRQSRPELGSDSLARQNGFRSAGRMIATTTGTTTEDAARMVTVGEATRERVSLSGEVRPAKYPHVAAGIDSGVLSVVAASAITGMLERVAPRVAAGDVEAMEARLVAAAPGLSPDQLRVLILRGQAHLDPDGVAPREEEQRAARTLSVYEDRAGMLILTGRLDPETAAPVKTALEGIVTTILRQNTDTTHGSSGTAGAGSTETTDVLEQDTRTIGQMRADALTQLCRHALGCEHTPTRPSATVVVRISLEDLQNDTGTGTDTGAGTGAGTGTGTATIDGISQSVSAGTARRLAADGQIIPYVLGTGSEILDWGRTRRLFTPAQRLALAERDGGCAFCGLPPALTAAHHIAWWQRDTGPTNLNNGILLCTSCHHRVHDNGWEIHIEGTGTQARVWFIPPPWIDHNQTPRPGARARFDPTDELEESDERASPSRRVPARRTPARPTDRAAA